jgi:hypothetical protein
MMPRPTTPTTPFAPAFIAKHSAADDVCERLVPASGDRPSIGSPTKGKAMATQRLADFTPKAGRGRSGLNWLTSKMYQISSIIHHDKYVIQLY